jgi:hypothetical protein
MTDPEQPRLASEASSGAAVHWTCPSCGAAAGTPYCGVCGERRLAPRDLRVVALLGHVLESITNVDGRIFRTFKALVLRPGELTLAYAEGRRKQYLLPFQVFLIANVAFFFLQSLLGLNVLSNSFSAHVKGQVYSPRALAIATQRLAAVGLSREAYEPVFDAAVEVNAKALVVLLVPGCALFAWLLSLGRGRPGGVHWVFALHFIAFWLLFLGALLPVGGVTLGTAFALLGIPDKWLDIIGSWLLFAASAVWVYRAFGRVYGGGAARRVLGAALIAFLVPVIRVYRLIVFLITLYTTT